MRNKPKEAPKVPKSAPFFLPTVLGLETKFDLSNEKDGTIGSTSFQNVLFLRIGAKVMIIHNVDTLDSITNGQLGVIGKTFFTFCFFYMFA